VHIVVVVGVQKQRGAHVVAPVAHKQALRLLVVPHDVTGARPPWQQRVTPRAEAPPGLDAGGQEGSHGGVAPGPPGARGQGAVHGGDDDAADDLGQDEARRVQHRVFEPHFDAHGAGRDEA